MELGSCSISPNSRSSLLSVPHYSATALSYGRHGAYCSYLIITFLFTLQSRSSTTRLRSILLRVRCQRVAYLYALFVLVPAN